MLDDMDSLVNGAWVILAGVALGIVFFGGLWWTVQHAARSTKPALWFIGSLFVRVGVVMTGFYLVGAGQLLQIGLCLVGFIIARAIVLRWSRNRKAPALEEFVLQPSENLNAQGEQHAPNP